MFKKFLWLEWKAFTRSASFGTNMALKIVLGILAVFYSFGFVIMSIAAFYGIREELHQDPLVVVSKYLVYYFLADITIKAMIQKIPVVNIKPMLTLPIKRSTIINFVLGKSFLSFFNVVHAFAVFPFVIVLFIEGYDPVGVLFFWLGLWLLVYINNLINVLMSESDLVFVLFIAVAGGFGALQYFGFFDITLVTGVFYHGLYATYYVILIPVVVFGLLYWYSHKYFRKKMYLDTGLKDKAEIADGREYTFLNRFGLMGSFLKNDLRLILRNKRSRNVLISSFIFLFYGVLIMTGIVPGYNTNFWKVLGGLMTTGSFLFTFGQFVPSWDSAYYPLMMSQNIRYRDYIASKWWLIVTATLISTLLCSFYLFWGVQTYLFILVGALYNVGVNSHLVLLGGAFLKTPIDLAAGKQAFADKKAFNGKVLLLSIPKVLIPVALYYLGLFTYGPELGYVLIAVAGIAGFSLRNYVFRMTERAYKSEKYSTLAAFKQKN
jgi:hypothetical protein